jgi:hypothetical protein
MSMMTLLTLAGEARSSSSSSSSGGGRLKAMTKVGTSITKMWGGETQQ